MVERFNRRINELLQQTRFNRRVDLQATLLNYLKLYNHHIPQRALGSKTPALALKEWQQNRPELFVKRVMNKRDSKIEDPELSDREAAKLFNI